MIVCVCHRVSEKEISQLATEGLGFAQIQRELGVASQCGRCEDCARELVDQCHAQSNMVQPSWVPISVSALR